MNIKGLFLILLLFGFLNAIAQRTSLNYEFENQKLDSNEIIRSILGDSPRLIYKKSDVIRDAKVLAANMSDLLGNAFVANIKNNIFFGVNSITIDSNYIISLVKKYQNFYITSNLIGQQRFLRPEFDLGRLTDSLQTMHENQVFHKQIWNHLYREIPEYLDTTQDFKNKLDSIKNDIINYKHFEKSFFNNSVFQEHLDSLAKLISSIELNVNLKKTDRSLSDSLRSLLFSFSKSIRTENEDIQLANEGLSKLPSDFPISLLLLASIDQRINYDTAYLNNRTMVMKQWIEDNKLNSVLTFSNIALDGAGRFTFTFHSYGHDQNELVAFLNNYKKIHPNHETYESFKTRLFFKVADIFRIPPDYLTVEMLSGPTTEIIVEEGNKIVTHSITRHSLPPGELAFIGPFPTFHTIIHEDEVNLNTSILSNFFQSNSGHIENIIYRAIAAYVRKRNINKENLQRIKVDDGEVIVWLNNVRNEILKNENYWENVQFRITAKKTRSDLKLTLITDGEFGTGIVIGFLGKPPSYSAYKPMEPKYFEQLKKYSADFLYKLKDILTSNY
jgi:hypothetical protein